MLHVETDFETLRRKQREQGLLLAIVADDHSAALTYEHAFTDDSSPDAIFNPFGDGVRAYKKEPPREQMARLVEGVAIMDNALVHVSRDATHRNKCVFAIMFEERVVVGICDGKADVLANASRADVLGLQKWIPSLVGSGVAWGLSKEEAAQILRVLNKLITAFDEQ